MTFSHINKKGEATMVDVSNKATTDRVAEASGSISLSKEAYLKVMNKDIQKGDVFAVCKTAGIMAAKQTSTY